MILRQISRAAFISGLFLAAPAFAQHAGHHMEPVTATPSPAAAGPAEHAEQPVETSPGPMMETPPPPEAGSGPPRAADAIWGAEAMRQARATELEAHGNFTTLWVQGDRLETHIHRGKDGYLWDLQGYYGGPTSRLWLKSEGEGAFGEKIEEATIQALWSNAISPYWDLQLGARQDVGTAKTSHAVIGLQGLAPFFFDVDAAAFLSDRGDVTARIEAELDQRVTQRWVLQPRAEVTLAAQDIPRLGIGAGIDTIDLGVRLRYEFIREFAPYLGIEQSWRIGNGAAFSRARGDNPRVTSFVAGVRFWF